MNSSDLDFEVNRKAKQGRRANKSPFNDVDLNSLENDDGLKTASRFKKTGGWAEDTLKSGKNKATTNLIEQQRFQEQKIDLDDDIPIIPEIEEIQEDGLEIPAEAPNVAVSQTVTMYKELDRVFLQQSSLRQFGDINISFLLRYMYLDDNSRESDETWSKESLFNELISNPNKIRDKQNI